MSARAFAGAASAPTPSIPSDRGYRAWSMPPSSVTGGTVLATAGTLYVTRIRRVPGGPVSNIVLATNVAGSTLTAGQCFAALFTGAGVPVGTSADQAAAWAGAAGVKTAALAGGPYAHAGGDLYVGMWFNGTTGPSMMRTGALSAMTNAGLAAPNFDSAVANTGLTTTAPATLGTQTSAAIQYWVALS